MARNCVFAQQLNYTLNRDYLWGYDNYFNNKEENVQTFVKPYRYSVLNNVKDSIAAFPKLFKVPQTKRFDIIAAPILTFQMGRQTSPTKVSINDFEIGGNIMGNVGKKLSFNLKMLTGEGTFNNATDSVIRSSKVVPGMGYAYKDDYNSLNASYSYQYYSGYVSYSPNKIFNFQAGQDKQFWGDGYRSLFLSDVAAPNPFLKITTTVWKLTYVNLYTIMKDATDPSGLKKNWLNKYATFHYLGLNVTKRINIGLFESIVWQGTDKTRNRGYDINYLNPVIFYNPTEFSLGSSDNTLLGFSYKIKLFKKQQLYGQLIIDDLSIPDLRKRNGYWANKYGIQTGFKSFDVFKINKLNFQTEVNYVTPYTYSHGSVQQNYASLNQPLAHPLGANFIESANFLNYRYKRMFFEAKCIYAVYGADTANSDYGKNIFISYAQHPHDYGNKILQGIRTNLINLSLRTAYIVDPTINLKVELGVAYRVQENIYGTTKMPYIFFGIRTDLCNLYNDY